MFMTRSKERGKGRRTHNRIGGERWLEPESDEMIDTPNAPLGGSQASPH